MMDENNNGDLSDDTIRFLTKQIMDPDQIVKASHSVSINYFSGGRLYEKKILVTVNQPFNTQHGEIDITFPEFAYVKFQYMGQPYLMVTSGDYSFLHFLAVIPDKPNFSPVNITNRARVNRFFKIGNDDFKLISINDFTNEVVIAKENIKNLSISATVNITARNSLPANTNHNNIISTSVGFTAPIVKGIDINAAKTLRSTISTQNLKGKYVFVDFWATYCGPCIEELPNLSEAYGKFGRDKFEIVGVLDENNNSVATKLLQEHNVTWPNVQLHAAKTDIEGYMPVVSFPTSYLIDPKGKIIAINLRGSDLISMLTPLISLK